MHYIVGTQFSKSGRKYSLYHITRKEDKVEYTFNESNGGDPLVLVFECSKDADNYIAKARRESLPNYTEFYSKNRG